MANSFTTDAHSAPVNLLTVIGSIIAEQTSIFKDKRTGATNIPVTNSGYRLLRNVTQRSPGNLMITTTKQGSATTANGYESGVAAGMISSKQKV